MEQLNYIEIDEFFRVPLSMVPKPHVPFKLKRWHIIGGITLLGFAAYGVYCANKNVRNSFNGFSLKNKKSEVPKSLANLPEDKTQISNGTSKNDDSYKNFGKASKPISVNPIKKKS